MTREERNAYMRRWTDANRDKLRQRRAERKAAIAVITRAACRRCGNLFNVTPALVACRVTVCSRCRRLTPEQSRAAAKRHQARHPLKARARWAVKAALKRGTLKRLACEQCGTARAQAHHDDYSQPLVVRWLCVRCHNNHHHAEVA